MSFHICIVGYVFGIPVYVMELFNSQEILDGSSLPRERESRQDKDGSKVSSLNFRHAEIPTDLRLE